MKTVHAILSKNGQVRLAEPVKIEDDQHVLVIFIEKEEEEEFVGGIPVTMLLSEKALADWNTPEEDEAWKHLQRDRS
jgi:hypothetical protein